VLTAVLPGDALVRMRASSAPTTLWPAGRGATPTRREIVLPFTHILILDFRASYAFDITLGMVCARGNPYGRGCDGRAVARVAPPTPRGKVIACNRWPTACLAAPAVMGAPAAPRAAAPSL
jgi:hypothetical protein